MSFREKAIFEKSNHANCKKQKSAILAEMHTAAAAAAASVTRCWNRKWPNFTQKLPKKRPNKLRSLKVIFFIRAQEVVNIWPAFVIKLVVKIVQKCSNEVTLGAFY